MKTVPGCGPRSTEVDDDQAVPEALAASLHRASAQMVREVIAGMSATQRANLAMYCYRKSHLREAGLAIAATLDRSVLIAAWGAAIGHALFEQSREAKKPEAVRRYRPEVTLGKLQARLVNWTIEDEGAVQH